MRVILKKRKKLENRQNYNIMVNMFKIGNSAEQLDGWNKLIDNIINFK